jgi:transposase
LVRVDARVDVRTTPRIDGSAWMIAPPPGIRVWLACGRTDMRKGMDGLAMLARHVLNENPFGGALFAFRGRRGDLIKVLCWDGQGLCLFANYLASYCSSFGLIRGL